MVAAEALSSGVMPVQTHHSGFIDVINVVKEHFRDNFQGLRRLDLDDRLIPNLANNLTVFLNYFSQMSDDERQIIRQRCNRLARENFSWAAITEKFIALV
jgi:glycosyltransferase involved in cell wall biosynthesis